MILRAHHAVNQIKIIDAQLCRRCTLVTLANNELIASSPEGLAASVKKYSAAIIEDDISLQISSV